jgi:ABC-type nitrate/sulfonate/bicarbonate transport system substrate-binding protein
MRNVRPNIRWKLLVGLLLTVTLAAGCGGEQSPAADNDTVRLVVSEGNSLPFIAAEAAESLGVWKEAGIKVQIIDATSSTVSSAMASRNADISLQAGVKAVGDIAAGLEATLIAGCVLPWDQYILAAPGIKAASAAELKGSRFGISGFGSAGHFATVKIADSLKWSTSDYEIVQLGSLDGMIAALKSGRIDAFIWSVEPVLTAVQGGYGTNLGSVAELVGPNAFEAFSVSDEFMNDNPDLTKKFFDGYYKAVAKLKADPAGAEKFVVDEWKKDPRVAKEAVDKLLPLLSDDGEIPDANIAGLKAAVALSDKDFADFDVAGHYTYWKDMS